MGRILIQGNMSTNALAQEIKNRELNLNDNNRPQKDHACGFRLHL